MTLLSERFPCVNWLVGWGTKKKAETHLTKKKAESERIDVLCEKVFSIEEINRKQSNTRERIAARAASSDAGRLAWCKANVLRRHRGKRRSKEEEGRDVKYNKQNLTQGVRKN